jgi:hypothetical protein
MSDYYDPEPYDELSLRLDRLEQAAEELGHDDPEADEYLPYQIAAESRQDSQSAREYLARIAEATQQEVFARAQALPQPPATDDEIFAAAKQSLLPQSTGTRKGKGKELLHTWPRTAST